MPPRTVDGRYRLVAMTVADLDRVMTLELASFTHPWTRDAFLGTIRAPFGHAWCLLEADHPESLGGYLVLWEEGPEAHLVHICIDPLRRRQGSGELLVRAAIRWARSESMAQLKLEVRESNLAALSLYKKCGFRTVSRSLGYYPDTGEDALLMAYELR